MSSFSVRPENLDAFADHMSAYQGGVTVSSGFHEARSYAESYVAITPADSSMFGDIVNANTAVMARLEDWFSSAGYLSGGCAIGLRHSAQIYRDSDAAQSAELDRVWPGSAAPTIPEGSGSRANVSDPSAALAATPSNATEVPDVAHWVMDKAGWLSLTSLALKLASLFGLDPAGDIAKAMFGDYGEVSRAGHAAKALAEFERASAQSVNEGLAAMMTGWTGNGADSTQAWFVDFSSKMEAHADQLDELGQLYSDLGQALSATAIAVSDALAFAGDQLLFLAAKLAAAGCLSSVPGVNVIAGLVGAHQVWVTQKAVRDFISMCNAVRNVAEGFLITVNLMEAWGNDYNGDLTLPSAPFSNDFHA